MDSARIHALTMPKWGLAMTEGRIAAWLVEEGAEVGPGLEVVDIETDKITSGLEPSESGVLRRRIAEADETVPVGGLVAVIAAASVRDDEIDSFVADFRARFVPAAVAEETAGSAPETIEANGFTLRYLRLGGPSAVPAVLLHGFGGDLNNWLFNHEALASTRAVYALDLPGHGGSSRIREFQGLSDFVRAVDAFVEIKGLNRAHFVGHSLGGAIAIKLAGQYPERVASLTLIASAGLGKEIDGDYIEGFITGSRRKDIKPVLDKLFADPSLVSRRLVDDVLKYKRLDGVAENLRAVAGRFCPSGHQAELLRDLLASIPVRTMAIWGNEDRIIPAAHAEGLTAGVETHRIPAAGHMVQMEAASNVNHLIESFWRRQD